MRNSSTLPFLVTFGLSLGGAVLVTLRARRRGTDWGIVDRPDGPRCRHDRPIPLVGGVAIFTAAALGLLAPSALALDTALPEAFLGTRPGILAVGAVIMFQVGLVDHVRTLRARTKFILEVIAAVGVCAAGIRLGALAIGEGLTFSLAPALHFGFTILWFVGITSAFNLVDGHDGVAGAVALLALATISYGAGPRRVEEGAGLRRGSLLNPGPSRRTASPYPGERPRSRSVAGGADSAQIEPTLVPLSLSRPTAMTAPLPFQSSPPRVVPGRAPTARIVVGSALLLAAGSAPASLAAQDYYTDVRPVLVESCMGCHSAEGPSWSMEDPEETYERRQRIARAVDRRIMPPWLAAPGHQDYEGDLSLDEASVALIQAWADAGFPRGEPRPDPEVDLSVRMAGHGSFAPDVTLAVNGEPGYLPNQERSDDYHCFLVDWSGEETTYVTGFRTVPGNRNVAHHLVVYTVRPEMWERYKEIDEEYGDGPGYGCFGGALPDELGRREDRAAYEARYPDGVRELARANDWLAHWAPGMDGHVFPAGTGIRLEPGAGLVVQMHYYASAAPGETDAGTRMEFMTSPRVERPAMMFAQTRNDWLSAENNGTMVIPSGQQRSYGLRDNLGGVLGYFAYVTGVPEERIRALELHSANLHMHAFGHSGEVVLSHASGEEETLLEIPRWDLGWQRDFTFTEPKILPREELEDTWLGMRCTYDNPTDQTVFGGLGSFDEMCFNFSYIAVQEGEATETSEGTAGR